MFWASTSWKRKSPFWQFPLEEKGVKVCLQPIYSSLHPPRKVRKCSTKLAGTPGMPKHSTGTLFSYTDSCITIQELVHGLTGPSKKDWITKYYLSAPERIQSTHPIWLEAETGKREEATVTSIRKHLTEIYNRWRGWHTFKWTAQKFTKLVPMLSWILST